MNYENPLIRNLEKPSVIHFVGGKDSRALVMEAYKALHEREPQAYTAFLGSSSYCAEFKSLRHPSAQTLEIAVEGMIQQKGAEDQITNIIRSSIRATGSPTFFVAQNLACSKASKEIFKKIAAITGTLIIHQENAVRPYDHAHSKEVLFESVRNLLDHYGFVLSCDVVIIFDGVDVTEEARAGGYIA